MTEIEERKQYHAVFVPFDGWKDLFRLAHGRIFDSVKEREQFIATHQDIAQGPHVLASAMSTASFGSPTPSAWLRELGALPVNMEWPQISSKQEEG